MNTIWTTLVCFGIGFTTGYLFFILLEWIKFKRFSKEIKEASERIGNNDHNALDELMSKPEEELYNEFFDEERNEHE